MKNYTYLLFDFDGTIMDTSEGIKHSFDRVVDVYHPDIPDKSVYDRMIGPPLKVSFAEVFRLKESDIVPAMQVYRSYYSVTGMFEAAPYGGITALLKELRVAGKKLFVATSKPEVYTRKILEQKGMLELFDFVGGSDLEEKGRVNKTDVIRYVLHENRAEDRKGECVMIGDTRYDIDGAKTVGIDSIGVLYGFGSRQSLEEAGADYIAEDVPALSRLLKNM